MFMGMGQAVITYDRRLITVDQGRTRRGISFPPSARCGG
jgi:hypothetical protein